MDEETEKAGAKLSPVPIMSTQALLESWAPALMRSAQSSTDPDKISLTKSEADAVLTTWMPGGNPIVRRHLHDQLTGVSSK